MNKAAVIAGIYLFGGICINPHHEFLSIVFLRHRHWLLSHVCFLGVHALSPRAMKAYYVIRFHVGRREPHSVQAVLTPGDPWKRTPGAGVRPARAPTPRAGNARSNGEDREAMTGDLFHSDGSRKYLTHDERQAFLTAAAQFPHDVRSFCYVLTYTGCRLAEALALTADRVDLVASRLTFETLKKRKRGVYRTVPVPPDVVTMLDFVHNIRRAQGRRDRGRSLPLMVLESRDRVAARQSGDAGRGDQGHAGQPERAPAWLRRGGGAGPHPAQPCAAVVGTCAVVDDSHLCRGGRTRRTGDRRTDVAITPRGTHDASTGGRAASHLAGLLPLVTRVLGLGQWVMQGQIDAPRS